MEKEDVEKAAIDSCVFEEGVFNPELTPYYVQGFKSGAEWRIGSVWHEVEDGLPEEGKMVLCKAKGIDIGKRSNQDARDAALICLVSGGII